MNEVKQEKTLSRIGRKPIPVPSSVTVEVQYGGVKVTGPKGTIEQKYHPEVVVKVEEGQVVVERQSANKFHHSLHGLTRSLIANAVVGVSEGFTKSLDVMGVGYRCSESGKGVTLNVGYCHPVDVFPDGDDVTIELSLIHI